MTDYLNFKLEDSAEFVSTYDELPLWSAPFGLLLLKHLEIIPGTNTLDILDIGSGTGFPLLEIAQRFGDSCRCTGLDTWSNANNRARQKIRNYSIRNAIVKDGSADNMPFENDLFDLVISNLGINNFVNKEKVFMECFRVIKPGGKLTLTTNLNGHWKEFYNVFEKTLEELNKKVIIKKIRDEQIHRGNLKSISGMFAESGFNVTKSVRDKFQMKFLNGSAFLNHHFIKLGWLESWKELIPPDDHKTIFSKLENNLNIYSDKSGGLTLTVPMLYIEGIKPLSK